MRVARVPGGGVIVGRYLDSNAKGAPGRIPVPLFRARSAEPPTDAPIKTPSIDGPSDRTVRLQAIPEPPDGAQRRNLRMGYSGGEGRGAHSMLPVFPIFLIFLIFWREPPMCQAPARARNYTRKLVFHQIQRADFSIKRCFIEN